VIASRNLVEQHRMIADDTGENIQAPGGTFWVGRGGDRRRQCQAFHQRHDIDAAGFEYRPLADIERMQHHFFKPLRHCQPAPRQEARPHPVGARAQSEIKARWLDLIVIEGPRGADVAARDHGGDRLAG